MSKGENRRNKKSKEREHEVYRVRREQVVEQDAKNRRRRTNQ